MAARIGSLYVELTADVQPFAQGMSRAQSVTGTATADIAKKAGVAERSVQSFWGSVGGGQNFRPYGLIAVSRAFDNAADRAGLLRGALLATTSVAGGFAAALSSNLLLRYADSFTKINNQVRVVSNSMEDASARFDALLESANRSRSSLEATAILYSRIQKASPDSDAGQVLQYVQTIQKALSLGGATAEEARSASIQFSQAIASNRLSGDEMRSILETPLGLELAKGLGVTIGKFREMGVAGELTSSIVLGALKKIAPAIDQQFSRSAMTVDQALIIVDNKLIDYIGRTNNAYGVTRLMTGAILGFGNNLEHIAPLLAQIAGLMAAVFAARNPRMLAGLAGAGLGAAIGGQLGGLQGALMGGALGGLLGPKLPDMFKDLKTGAKEASERVIELRGKMEALRSTLVDAEMKRSSTARALLGDSSGFADKGAASDFKRAEAQVESFRQKTVAAHKEVLQAQRDLAGITSTVSPRAAKLSDDIANAEERVNGALQRQAQIRDQLRGTRSQELGALGLQATTGPLSTASAATKERIALERELGSVGNQVSKDRETIAAREIQIAGLVSAADQKAAQQRIQAARDVAAAKERYSNTRLQFGVSQLDLQDATRNVSLSGDQNARRALLDQTENLRKIHDAISPVAANLEGAERAATRFGTVGSFVARQWGSIIGLFGGPWGVAITSAIGIMGYLGIKAQEDAQKVAAGWKIIDEALQRAGKARPDDVAAQKTIIEQQAEKIEASIKEATDIYERMREDVLSRGPGRSVLDVMAATSDAVPSDFLETQKTRSKPVDDLITRLKDGKITASEFKDQLSQIGESDTGLKSLIDAAIKLADKFEQAATAAKQLKQEKMSLGVGPEFNTSAFDLPKQDTKSILHLSQRVMESQDKIYGETPKSQALKYMIDQAAQGNYIDYNWALKQFTKIQANEFAGRIVRMRQEAEGSFLGDTDRQVLEMLRQKQAPPEQIKGYIAAARSGDYSKVPQSTKDIRDLKILEDSGKVARSTVQQYGNWAQIMPLAAEEQQKLNVAVANGAITAGQAKVAYADFLATFGNYKWITSATDAIGTFAESAIFDFRNIGQAASNLALTLAKLAISTAFIDPAKQGLKGFLSADVLPFFGFGTKTSAAGAGLPAASAPPLAFGGGDFSFHGGGKVGVGGRYGNHGSFAGVPRFHSGLTSREFKAVLERGEHVLTGHQADRTAGTIAGLTQRVGTGGGVKFSPTVQIMLPQGATKTDVDQANLVGASTKKALFDLYREFTISEMAPGGLHNP